MSVLEHFLVVDCRNFITRSFCYGFMFKEWTLLLCLRGRVFLSLGQLNIYFWIQRPYLLVEFGMIGNIYFSVSRSGPPMHSRMVSSPQQTDC